MGPVTGGVVLSSCSMTEDGTRWAEERAADCSIMALISPLLLVSLCSPLVGEACLCFRIDELLFLARLLSSPLSHALLVTLRQLTSLKCA